MFMPQDVFNGCALVVAQAGASGLDMVEHANDLADEYGRTYKDEWLAAEIFDAAEHAFLFFESVFSGEVSEQKIASAYKTIFSAMNKFHLDGKPKRRWLKGALFHRQKTPICDKVAACKREISLYHFAITTGLIDPQRL
jgi:hypothetical protein